MHVTGGQIALALFGLFFVWFGVAYLRRSRQRRRELYGEPTRRPGLDQGDSDDDDALVTDASDADKARRSPPTTDKKRDLRGPEADDRAEEGEDEDEDDDELEGADQGADRAASDDDAETDGEPEPKVDAQLEKGLARTHDGLWSRLGRLFGGAEVDSRVLDELEEALLLADVGVKLSQRMVGELRSEASSGKLRDGAAMRAALKRRMQAAVATAGNGHDPLALGGARPHVILFVGVNGVGKTTTIGKIASKLRASQRKVLLAAGDTFRAAAVEQLAIWGDRSGSAVFKAEAGADPASVVFNAVQHARAQDVDVVLADTAGRLHTKTELMDEIRKVKRAVGKARDGAPDQVWLVVDATTGQNAVRQAEEFHQALGLTGVILTKLDGTAKGGVVIAIADSLKLPVLFIGIGEGVDDLRPFDAHQFVDALFAR